MEGYCQVNLSLADWTDETAMAVHTCNLRKGIIRIDGFLIFNLESLDSESS